MIVMCCSCRGVVWSCQRMGNTIRKSGTCLSRISESVCVRGTNPLCTPIRNARSHWICPCFLRSNKYQKELALNRRLGMPLGLMGLSNFEVSLYFIAESLTSAPPPPPPPSVGMVTCPPSQECLQRSTTY